MSSRLKPIQIIQAYGYGRALLSRWGGRERVSLTKDMYRKPATKNETRFQDLQKTPNWLQANRGMTSVPSLI